MTIRHRFTRTLAALALTFAGVAMCTGVAEAKGGDLPQNVTVTADCGGVGSAIAGYNKSGSRVNLWFNVTSAPTGTSWQVSASDNGAKVFDLHLVSIGSLWTVLQTFDAPKGNNVVTMVADADDGSQHCSATLTFKV